jgi:hypothetical protein|tara:strand:+ start:418 stop:519 length:102 start_codon:yes stop_codon:yes gene_type:complete
MVGNEDLGEDARVGADNVHYRRTKRAPIAADRY